MNHGYLCIRAAQWLSGSRRCNVVLSGIASTREVPDAIGWATTWRWYGSTVVECKTSTSDFHRDKRKKHQTRMGVRRFFLVPFGLISAVTVEEHYPDHGLLYVKGRRIIVVREAPERTDVDLRSENLLLQFAIIHMRANLLRMGMTVDMNLLTKHPFTVLRRKRLEETNGHRQAGDAPSKLPESDEDVHSVRSEESGPRPEM